MPHDSPPPASLVFFLGGADLEMQTIAALVREALGPAHVVDKGARWGITAAAYADAMADALARGAVPVAVELDVEEVAPHLRQALLVVDHHGGRAGAQAPTALEQVFALLRLPARRWTRRLALVAANDRGYIPEMLALGATPDEIAAIRAADRAAQGITPDEEQAAAAAVDAALASGPAWSARDPLVVTLPHGRTACVMDRLSLPAPDGTPGPGTRWPVVVLCPAETNVFAPGPAIMALDRRFPGGWRGGALPRHGFWGQGRRLDEAAVVETVRGAVSPEAKPHGPPRRP